MNCNVMMAISVLQSFLNENHMRRKVVSVVLLALSGLVDAAKKKASKTSTSSSEWIERSVPLSAGVCNMRSLDANQPLDELVSDLLGLTEPVLLRVGNIEPWSRTHLFERLGGSLEVDVSVGEGVIGPSDVDASGDSPRHKMTLLDFADGLRNRTLPRDAYIFNTLALDGMADVESGTSIETSTVIQPLFRAVMASTLPRLMQLESSGTWPNATKGSLRLALGGSLSGNGWHAHGLAMNCVLSGRLATQVPSRNSTVQPTEHPLPNPQSPLFAQPTEPTLCPTHRAPSPTLFPPQAQLTFRISYPLASRAPLCPGSAGSSSGLELLVPGFYRSMTRARPLWITSGRLRRTHASLRGPIRARTSGNAFRAREKSWSCPRVFGTLC